MEPGAPRHRGWYYGGFAVLALLLIAGALLAKPVYHRFKLWRALQLTEASAEALRGNDLRTAREKAEAAIELYPADAQVERQAALVTAQSSQLNSLPFWYAAWQISHDPADHREFILAALQARQFNLAAEQLKQLQAEDPASPLTAYVEARVDYALSHFPEAMAAAKRAMDSGQAPDRAHLVYALAAQNSPDPKIRADGIDYLRQLGTRTDSLGLAALVELGNFDGITPADQALVAQLLLKHPLAGRDDKLLALRLGSHVPGANDDAILQTARELYPVNDPAGLVEIGRWLNTQHKYAETLKLIDSTTAQTRRDLFQIRLDAMAAEGQWAAINKVLQQPNLPLPEDIRLLFRARTLSALQLNGEADNAWDAAKLALINEPEKLRDFAEYASKVGKDDVARSVYQRLVQDLGQRRNAYEKWVQLERRGRHTSALHQVLLKMAADYPEDPAVINDLVYTGFLLGQSDDQSILLARKNVEQFPNLLVFRTTLGLGYLRANRAAEALALFDGLDVDWNTAPATMQVAYIATLRANGHLAEAAALEKNLSRQNLLPEEAALLDTSPSLKMP